MMGENFFLQSFILPPTTSSSITKSVPEPTFVTNGWQYVLQLAKSVTHSSLPAGNLTSWPPEAVYRLSVAPVRCRSQADISS